MKRSEQINELATALSKAQGEFEPIPKNKEVDFQPQGKARVHYFYADLADVISIVTKTLSKHGLSIVQPIYAQEKEMIIETILMHTSGQWLSASYPIPFKERAQEQGSEITYGRRYCLCSMLGVQADEDDDGKMASDDVEQNRNYHQRPVAQPIKPAAPAKIMGSVVQIPAAASNDDFLTFNAPAPKPAPIVKPAQDPRVEIGIEINKERKRLNWDASAIGKYILDNIGKEYQLCSVDELELVLTALKRTDVKNAATS